LRLETVTSHLHGSTTSPGLSPGPASLYRRAESAVRPGGDTHREASQRSRAIARTG
jgi:hypothetical protein